MVQAASIFRVNTSRRLETSPPWTPQMSRTAAQRRSLYFHLFLCTSSVLLSSFLGSTAQLRPWPPPQSPDEFLGGFSTIFFFYRVGMLAPRPTPIPEDQASVFISPRCRETTHFSRLLRHAWVTVGLFLFPGHHTENVVQTSLTNITFSPLINVWYCCSDYLKICICLRVTTSLIPIKLSFPNIN
jgi:hypothetical protein